MTTNPLHYWWRRMYCVPEQLPRRGLVVYRRYFDEATRQLVEASYYQVMPPRIYYDVVTTTTGSVVFQVKTWHADVNEFFVTEEKGE